MASMWGMPRNNTERYGSELSKFPVWSYFQMFVLTLIFSNCILPYSPPPPSSSDEMLKPVTTYFHIEVLFDQIIIGWNGHFSE